MNTEQNLWNVAYLSGDGDVERGAVNLMPPNYVVVERNKAAARVATRSSQSRDGNRRPRVRPVTCVTYPPPGSSELTCTSQTCSNLRTTPTQPSQTIRAFYTKVGIIQASHNSDKAFNCSLERLRGEIIMIRCRGLY